MDMPEENTVTDVMIEKGQNLTDFGLFWCERSKFGINYTVKMDIH